MRTRPEVRFHQTADSVQQLARTQLLLLLRPLLPLPQLLPRHVFHLVRHPVRELLRRPLPGRSRRARRHLLHPAHVRHRVRAPDDGADGLGDVPPLDGEADLGECDRDVDESLSSAEFIAQTVRERPGEVTIIVTSPATNLALAVVLEPRLPELVKRVLIMGGAVDHPGNVSPLAEANFAHDSRAAKVVVDAFSSDAGDRLVIAPLDVTMKAMATVQQMQQLTKAGVGGSLLAEAWRGETLGREQRLHHLDRGVLANEMQRQPFVLPQREQQHASDGAATSMAGGGAAGSVSYTHLTLPTILLV